MIQFSPCRYSAFSPPADIWKLLTPAERHVALPGLQVVAVDRHAGTGAGGPDAGREPSEREQRARLCHLQRRCIAAAACGTAGCAGRFRRGRSSRPRRSVSARVRQACAAGRRPAPRIGLVRPRLLVVGRLLLVALGRERRGLASCPERPDKWNCVRRARHARGYPVPRLSPELVLAVK